MNTELKVVEPEGETALVAATPLDLPVAVFTAALERRQANRAALMTWIRQALVDKVDFGRIHSVGKSKCQYAARGNAAQCQDPSHWAKPSLWKPGAEKICGMLGVTVTFPTLYEYERAVLSGVTLTQVILRCELHDGAGKCVADGVGARSLPQDFNDLNKSLKMAEKSAHIDATLRMAGLSEVFTQDIEDMPQFAGQVASAPVEPVKESLNQRIEPVPAKPARVPIGADSDDCRTILDGMAFFELDQARVLRYAQGRYHILGGFGDLTEVEAADLVKQLPNLHGKAEAEAKARAAAQSRVTPPPKAGRKPRPPSSAEYEFNDTPEALIATARDLRESAEHADDPKARREDLRRAAELESKAKVLEDPGLVLETDPNDEIPF